MVTMPDPLLRGQIPGQNPNTPERLPGHTAYQPRHAGLRATAPWAIAGILVLLAALYVFGVIGH